MKAIWKQLVQRDTEATAEKGGPEQERYLPAHHDHIGQSLPDITSLSCGRPAAKNWMLEPELKVGQSDPDKHGEEGRLV